MRSFIRYLIDFLRNTPRPTLFLTLLLVASLVAGNYTFGIEHRIQALPWYAAIGGFFGFFSAVLALVWGLQYEWNYKERALTTTPTLHHGRIQVSSSASPSGYFQPRMLTILALAALYFAAKMVHWDLSPLLPRSVAFPWDRYTLLILQLPLKLLLLLGLLMVLHRTGLLEDEQDGPIRHEPGSLPRRERGWSFFSSVGLTRRGFKLLPYFGLLLAVVPLIALAATQHDFLQVYPKVKNLAFLDGYAHPSWPWKLGYEVSYGLDFLSIELFFRGLLVVGLLRFVGTDAILPMAAFYCTIHFGKPLGECISSFFGGLILGVLAARTRSILGGLIVHLGLAWLMEAAGWIGHGWS